VGRLGELPRFDEDGLAELRVLAERCWAQATAV
jgi:hypothetical protein